MTVGKGADWGAAGRLAAGSPVVGDDRSIVEALRAMGTLHRGPAIAPGGDPPEVGVTGGDLHRTVGSPSHTAGELYDGEGMRLPVDLGVVVLPGPPTGPSAVPEGGDQHLYFCAHLVCTPRRRSSPTRQRRLFSGSSLVVMNAAFRGDENLAPRAHPGDARLDVIEGRLPRGDLWRARKRMRAGTHVPHPGLRQRRITEAEFDLGEAMVVAIDGEAVANARHLVVRCLPDAFVMVV